MPRKENKYVMIAVYPEEREWLKKNYQTGDNSMADTFRRIRRNILK
jgi:hypothetical protein